jgi:hypothetical protein
VDPTLPASPLFTRVFAEHPWTPVTFLLIVGAALAWYGAHNERAKLILAGVASLLLAAGMLTLAYFVQSPGERAAEAVRHLVRCAEQADVSGVADCFTPDASIQYGSLTGTGEDMAEILRAANSLRDRHRIQSNSITHLQFATIDDDRAQVLLGCTTATAGSAGFSVPTSWWMQLARQPDGTWRINRIAFLRYMNQPASSNTI